MAHDAHLAHTLARRPQTRSHTWTPRTVRKPWTGQDGLAAILLVLCRVEANCSVPSSSSVAGSQAGSCAAQHGWVQQLLFPCKWYSLPTFIALFNFLLAHRGKHLKGNLQDRMDVLMSKIRAGETVVIDVAVIKATMQNPKPPKEKHVAVLKMACAGASPRQQVAYTIHQLAARLDDKPGWLVALKTLIVFHRLMRETHPSFQVRSYARGKQAPPAIEQEGSDLLAHALLFACFLHGEGA